MAADTSGDSPDDLILKISVAELCKIADVAPTFYYREARHGRAPKPQNGLTLAEAKSWLDKRFAKKVARAEAVRRLRAAYGAKDP
jgi:hypothetical protein